MNITLVNPPSPFLLDDRVFPSLGVLKVASYLMLHGHSVRVCDLSGMKDFSIIDDYMDCDAFGITATTPQMPSVMEVMDRLEGKRVVLGGPHVTLVHAAVQKESGSGRAHIAWKYLTDHFSQLVSGDGLAGALAAFENSCVSHIDTDSMKSEWWMNSKDYSESPEPSRDLIDILSYKYEIEGYPATSLIAQLGCPFQSVTGDSLVFTDNGFERVDSLLSGLGELRRCVHGGEMRVHKIERLVSTHQGNSVATEVMQEGVKEVLSVFTENGTCVKATAEHPFLVADKEELVWKNVGDLSEGDFLLLKNPGHQWPLEYFTLNNPEFRNIPPGGFSRKSDKTPRELTEDVAWLIGYVIGDGCIPVDGRPSIHVCVTEKIEGRLKSTVKECFGVDLSINDSNVTDKMQHGWIHSRAAYEFFTQSLGISPSNKLHIPKPILRSPKSVAQAFIRGLFDADGYDNRGRPYLTTVSYDLAVELSNLMLMLDDLPNIQKVQPRDRQSNPYYRVGYFYNDRIPSRKALYKSNKSGKWHWRTPRNKKSFLGVRSRTLKESGLSHPLYKPGHHYVRVEKIIRSMPERVYDLHVPGAHSFNVNGLIAHNCGFCGGRNSPSLRFTRNRPSEDIVNEVEALYLNYGFTGFMFLDDELNVNPKFVELLSRLKDLQDNLGVGFRMRGFLKAELFTEDQAKAMYEAGFRWILCGFEGAHERILKNIRKRATLEDNTRVIEIAKKNGLKVKALMSIGHPGESEDTVDSIQKWLITNSVEDFDCTVITPYPGTPYYDESGWNGKAWEYTQPDTGDKLYSRNIDYTTESNFYKGIPGEYKSMVWTDYLSRDGLASLRDQLEDTVRGELGLAYPGVNKSFEQSMGQTP